MIRAVGGSVRGGGDSIRAMGGSVVVTGVAIGGKGRRKDRCRRTPT